MDLHVLKRDLLTKSATKKIRREGGIPCALYVRGKATDNITVNSVEFGALMRALQPGRLSTSIFTLIDGHGKKRRAILKEIQYEPTTYEVRHLDFEELFDDVKVKLKVPVECSGVVDCVGIKLGGVLRQVIRHVLISCLPKDIPAAFQIDVRNLALFESRRLSEIEMPKTVRPLANLNEVAVVIAKR